MLRLYVDLCSREEGVDHLASVLRVHEINTYKLIIDDPTKLSKWKKMIVPDGNSQSFLSVRARSNPQK